MSGEISAKVSEFIRNNKSKLSSPESSNSFLKEICGINNFFNESSRYEDFLNVISEKNEFVKEPIRRDYGDFQTNYNLVSTSIDYILSLNKNINFDFVLEPTCGNGNFIISALKRIPSLKKIVGIEIYEPYIWETKFKILEYFIEHPRSKKPEIEIIKANVFNFNFKELSEETYGMRTLIIGNPPWVTNSELSSIESENIPDKSNYKNYKGLDAITGKGNFDIGEFISILILKNFCNHSGYFGFLIKNSVAKNLLFEQMTNKFRIGEIKKLNFDAKKEFNASVDACLFVSEMNHSPEMFCVEEDLYSHTTIKKFGWVNNRFVSSIDDYNNGVGNIEGSSQFIWRQGIKHDCSKIMELVKNNGKFVNGYNQEVNIENDLVFGLIKSSELKGGIISSGRKSVIVTQKKIGECTDYIRYDFPLTYNYLLKNKNYFAKRKSKIYDGKPEFSIFGIGDYSFAPYKIAISGMYKTTIFTLILPDKDGKPVMLDDTCYFIGFNDFDYAKIAYYLLNLEITQKFLRTIIFTDSKRAITKEVLMRIDFYKLYKSVDFNSIINEIDIPFNKWVEFGNLLEEKMKKPQGLLFGISENKLKRTKY